MIDDKTQDGSSGSVPSHTQGAGNSSPGSSHSGSNGPLSGSTLPGGSAASTYAQLKPGAIFGPYEILSVIGHGGMGKVFKAKHTESQQLFALKVMSLDASQNESAVRRFQRESKAAARLQHPNIVAAFDADEIGGAPYLALELIEGIDLSKLVKAEGLPPVMTAVNYIRQAATGLAYAHSCGVIHRDIKPSNLMLARQTETVKLLDLGLARIESQLEEATRVTELTSTGSVFGTVDYMAPEQARDSKRADARSDIYSLGCTLHYLLTGKVLYESDSILHKIRQHSSGEIPDLTKLRDSVPQMLAQVFRRMVAKKPEQRLASMQDVVTALGEVLEVLTGTREDLETPPEQVDSAFDETRLVDSFVREAPVPARRSKGMLFGVATVGVLLLTTVGWLLTRPGEKQHEPAPEIKEVAQSTPPSSTDPADSKAEAPTAELTVVAKDEWPLVAWSWPKDLPKPLIAPVTTDEAKLLQTRWAEAVKLPVVASNSLDMPLAIIPPGEFEMGAPGNVFGIVDPGAAGIYELDQSRPVRRVRLTRPFQLGVQEVTVAQFRRFIEATGYKTLAEKDGKGGWLVDENAVEQQKTEHVWSQPTRADVDAQEPVRFVDRVDAEAFCAWLSEQEKTTYRLPTEAEWEFACRAGSGSKFGVTESANDVAAHAWSDEGRLLLAPDRRPYPHPVGGKLANPFGLFDMLGNVWELCGEGFHPASYQRDPERDVLVNPSLSTGAGAPRRGGCWFEPASSCNPAIRLANTRPNGHTGFRVVKELPVIAALEPQPDVPEPKRGEPLTARASVSSPSTLEGVQSWSVEPVGFRGPVESIAYSPAARLVAAGGTNQDPVIRVYDEKLVLQRLLLGSESDTTSLAFSPDGKFLAACAWRGSWDYGLWIWHVPSSRLICRDRIMMWNPPAVVWSPDGRYLALASNYQAIVREVRTGICRSIESYETRAVTWSPDGKQLAVGEHSGRVRILSIPAFNVLRTLPTGSPAVNLSWSPNGKWLVSNYGLDVRVLDSATLEVSKTFKSPLEPRQILWTPDSKQLVFTGTQAVLWDFEAGQQVKALPVAGAATWVKPGESLVFGRNDGLLEMRSLAGLPLARSVDRGRQLDGWHALSPDGSEVLTRIGKDALFFDAETGESRGTHRDVMGSYAYLEWAPDGRHYATWSGAEVRIIQRGDGEKVATLKGPKEGIHSVAWSPDAKQIVMTSPDKTVRIWDALTGRETAQQAFAGPAYDAVWSHGGEAVAVALLNETVLLNGDGTTITGRHAQTESYAFAAGMHGLAWSPDDRWLTTGGTSSRVELLDVKSGEFSSVGTPLPVAPFGGSNAWANDGQRAFSRTGYGEGVLFELHRGTCIRLTPFLNAAWHADGRRLTVGLANQFELFGYDTQRQRRTGVLIPALANRPDQSLCIGGNGHVRGPASEVAYVALLQSGEQRTYSQQQFEKSFGWKNDSTQASFLKPLSTETAPTSELDLGKLFATLPGQNEVALTADPRLIESWSQRGAGERALVAQPTKVEGLATWTIESTGHRGYIEAAVAYSPTGKVIASAGHDCVVRLWEAEQCRSVGVLVGSTSPITTLSWSRSGRYLASTGDDRVVRLWDVVERRLLREITLPTAAVHLTWSANADRLAAAVYGGCLVVDAQSGQIEEVANQRDGAVYWPTWSPDEKWLAVAQWDVIRIHDAQTLELSRELAVPPAVSGVYVLEWSPHGDVLIGTFGAHSRRIGIWDATTGQYLGDGDTPAALNPRRTRFSQDGSRALVGADGRQVFDVATRRVIAGVPALAGCDLSPDGQRVAGLRGNQIVVTDFMTGREVSSSSLQGSSNTNPAVASSADGKRLFAVVHDTLFTFDADSGRVLNRTRWESWHGIAPSPLDNVFAARREATLVLFSTTDRKQTDLRGHGNYIYSMSFNKDGSRLASMSQDKALLIWDTTNATQIKKFELPDLCDHDIVWQADDKELRVRSRSGITLRINAETGAVIERTASSASIGANVVASLNDNDRSLVLETGALLRVNSSRLNRTLSSTLLGLELYDHATISANGHWRGTPFVEPRLAFVAIDNEGRQFMLTAAEFKSRFGWGNDPTQVTLATIPPKATPSPPAQSAESFEADRRAISKIISVGGWGRVVSNGRLVAPRQLAEIPAGSLQLREVELANTQVTDTDLEVLKGLPLIRRIDLSNCPKLTSAALTAIGPQPQLLELFLQSNPALDDNLKLDLFPKLSRLSLNSTSFSDAIGPQLAMLQQLTALDLSGSKPTAAIISHVAKLPRLRELVAYGIDLNDDAIEQLATLPQLRELHFNKGTFTSRTTAALSKNSALRRLTFYGSAASDDVLDGFTDQSQVRWLMIQAGQTTDRGAKAIARLKNLNQLTLTQAAISDDALRALMGLPLRYLDFNGDTGFTGSGFDAAGDKSTLRDLRLVSTQATPAGLRSLSRLKSLSAIYVSGSAVDAGMMTELAQLPALDNLSIYVATSLTPDALKALSPAPKLTWLHLTEADLNDEHWAALQQFVALNRVIVENSKLKQADLDHFKSARPKVILEVRGGSTK